MAMGPPDERTKFFVICSWIRKNSAAFVYWREGATTSISRYSPDGLRRSANEVNAI